MTGNRRKRPPRAWRWSLAAILTVTLSACAAAPGERYIPRSGDVSRPKNFIDFMLSVRESPADRDVGVAACVRARGRSLDEFLPVIIAMMDAPPQDSVRAFCAAAAEAAIAGDFSEADIRALSVPRGQRDYRVFGRFLRALLIANERLGTPQATASSNG
jgi:hypothetical protein